MLSGFTWRIAAAAKPSAPAPAPTPPSLLGAASRSPVAGVALPLARGSAFLAVETQRNMRERIVKAQARFRTLSEGKGVLTQCRGRKTTAVTLWSQLLMPINLDCKTFKTVFTGVGVQGSKPKCETV
ncbi:hypothetical protein ATANTOWER_005347 [Ataeniobius toweri]|uniref:Uncharacterized protein n=1 Tax=Ataeniobius toweri TaxID=208326 RepID=A0ABU7AUR6_9TELE|nr:hypothetical protein [Ataeniobius toweri]